MKGRITPGRRRFLAASVMSAAAAQCDHSMNEQESFSYAVYEQQTHLAELELFAFMRTVTEALSKAMPELIDGLAPNGKLLVVGASFDPIEVTPIQLIMASRSIQGWTTGTPSDSEDTLRFSELKGVHPLIETYPLDQAERAYARMMSGEAQFRVVLTM